jgi:hypothetical protein
MIKNALFILYCSHIPFVASSSVFNSNQKHIASKSSHDKFFRHIYVATQVGCSTYWTKQYPLFKHFTPLHPNELKVGPTLMSQIGYPVVSFFAIETHIVGFKPFPRKEKRENENIKHRGNAELYLGGIGYAGKLSFRIPYFQKGCLAIKFGQIHLSHLLSGDKYKFPGTMEAVYEKKGWWVYLFDISIAYPLSTHFNFTLSSTCLIPSISYSYLSKLNEAIIEGDPIDYSYFNWSKPTLNSFKLPLVTVQIGLQYHFS